MGIERTRFRHARRVRRTVVACVAAIAALSMTGIAGADPSAPTIVGFDPTSAHTGASLTIHGSGFSGMPVSGGVQVGALAADPFVVRDDTQIVATVPNGAVDGPITITTAGGTATSTDVFHVDLSVTGIGPQTGPVGTPLRIDGVGFSSQGPVKSVGIGGVPATRFTVDSDSEITARIPEGAVDGPISVTTDTGTVTSRDSVHVGLRHIVMIVMENRSLSGIDGSSSAPYINNCLIHRDLGRCADPATAFPTASYTQSFAATQAGSQYAYLDLTSGNDPYTEGGVCKFSILGCPDADPNIVDQVEAAGLTWASYAEDYPAPGTCSLKNGVKRVGANDTAYGAGHVPFIHYTDIRSNAARCTHFFGNPSGLTKAGLPVGGDAGLKQLTLDLSRGTLPAYSFITPNEYSDMHTACSSGVCPPGAPDKTTMGDRFLAYWIPHLMAGLSPDDRIVVTWDEGATKDKSGCCVVAGGPKIAGGHIPTFVVGWNVTQGNVSTPVTPYSFLTAIEDTFSLPGNIPAATAGQAHQLAQPYGTCACTPRITW